MSEWSKVPPTVEGQYHYRDSFSINNGMTPDVHECHFAIRNRGHYGVRELKAFRLGTDETPWLSDLNGEWWTTPIPQPGN